MTKYFVDAVGVYLGGFDGVEPPAGAVEVPTAPDDARQVWASGAWSPAPTLVPTSVSARQFKLQLLAAGLLSQVETWVGSQSQAVQIAYANSGSFVRSEPMMQSGFTALDFSDAQIDAFFTAAALL
ncbi:MULTISPECIES: hypothetical protein [unclassified Mesorhizobium]|uniref:hypothetical protein n=1 Tax=unclassified Mesorhizobium TaxID=325217 RepID=UPI001FDFF765|nr:MULTISPECIES: hypothetical protein [unclassified Mesorhizobium]MCT2580603.1 hypothetical protein [Mesorhizobium sp. P13.3]MDF3169545.1 hypothetical protein [Mesorhizobium sp. P16.1]MDF3178793.1 hypothetical protein [Mesorhizobium sp. P17.1]MDF3186460.1 hypothetical protein [Mesorhizobium sp. ICCV3110.1]